MRARIFLMDYFLMERKWRNYASTHLKQNRGARQMTHSLILIVLDVHFTWNLNEENN